MKRALILVNAYSKLQHSLNQSERLRAELARLGVDAEIRHNDFFISSIDGDGNLTADTREYDFCIYLDKDKYVSEMLEKSGLRLFNSSTAIADCDDKMITSIRLSGHDIPLPSTLPGLLCYDPAEPIREETLDRIEARLGYPLIAKESYGSLGKGVYKIDNRAALRDVAERLKCKPHLFQAFVGSSFGRDIRVIVIGGQCVAAMIRQSNGDFRSNLELGGVGTPMTPSPELKTLCERVAAVLRLDYCGIDLLFGENGYLICEVNSNAFFGGIESVTHINIAERYARYICSVMYGQ